MLNLFQDEAITGHFFMKFFIVHQVVPDILRLKVGIRSQGWKCQQRISVQELIMHISHINVSVCNCIELVLPQHIVEISVPKIGDKTKQNLIKSMFY